jgi:hypothetical protein
MQKIVSIFTDQVNMILNDELKYNSSKVTEYLNLPHNNAPKPEIPPYEPTLHYTIQSNL